MGVVGLIWLLPPQLSEPSNDGFPLFLDITLPKSQVNPSALSYLNV